MGKINQYIKNLIKKRIKKRDEEKPWLDWLEDVPEKLDYYTGSLYDAIKESGDKYSKLTAYEYFFKKCTYKDFVKKVDKAAKALKAMGIKENECVTICMPNIPEGVALKIDYLWFDGCGSENHEFDQPRIIRTIRTLRQRLCFRQL